MKNDNTSLHPSEELATRFAPYREEEPLLPVSRVADLLDRHDQLSTTKRPHTTRNTIMTLTGILALFAIYLSTTSVPSELPVVKRKGVTSPETVAPETQKDVTKNFGSSVPAQSVAQNASPSSLARTEAPKKTADTKSDPTTTPEYLRSLQLSDDELAKLGIVRYNDSIAYYEKRRDANGRNARLPGLYRHTFTAISNGSQYVGPEDIPANIDAPDFFPIFVTKENGAVRLFQYGDSAAFGMTSISDGAVMERFRTWLKKPGQIGYRALGFTTSSNSDGATTHNEVTIQIGKDLPDPIFPLVAPDIQGYDKSVTEDLIKLAHFYDGSGSAVDRKWPSNLTIKVDTQTAQDLLEEMDREMNNGSMTRMRGVLERLHDLVPVRVSSGNDNWLFWYEPTSALRDRIPTRYRDQIITQVKPQTDYLYTQINDSITVRFTRAPERIILQDLLGGIVEAKHVPLGSSSASFAVPQNNANLFLLVAEYGDGSKESMRVLTHAFTQAKSVSSSTIQHPLTSFIQLSDSALGKIGLQNSQDAVLQYTAMGGPTDGAFVLGVLRSWGVMSIGNGMMQRSNIPAGIEPPHFSATFVTDGLGRRRLFSHEVTPNQPVDSALAATEFQHIDKLVPILIRETPGAMSVGAKDLVFWFKPTKEFLAALPQAIREQVIAQTDSVSSRMNVANRTPQTIRASVYPNPATTAVHLRISVPSAQVLSFTLRNLLGQELKPTTLHNVSDGSIEDLDIQGVGDGLYLVDIANEVGEHFIQRLVIVH